MREFSHGNCGEKVGTLPCSATFCTVTRWLPDTPSVPVRPWLYAPDCTDPSASTLAHWCKPGCRDHRNAKPGSFAYVLGDISPGRLGGGGSSERHRGSRQQAVTHPRVTTAAAHRNTTQHRHRPAEIRDLADRTGPGAKPRCSCAGCRVHCAASTVQQAGCSDSGILPNRPGSRHQIWKRELPGGIGVKVKNVSGDGRECWVRCQSSWKCACA